MLSLSAVTAILLTINKQAVFIYKILWLYMLLILVIIDIYILRED